MTAWLVCWFAGAAAPQDVVLRGGHLVGVGVTDVAIRQGKIAEIGPGVAPDLLALPIAGRWIVPAFVDSHVHLAYRNTPEALGDGGIAAAVDLAAPLGWIGRDQPPLRVLWSGPMITAPGGYPLDGWGRDGYGWPAADPLAAGAGVLKMPVSGGASLDPVSQEAVVAAAHALGKKVVAHALTDADARAAARAGADALAHTPVSPLSDATVQAWAGRAVISTLGAFGGTPEAVDNLRRLRAAGATVLYGTDYGNTTTPGIDARELALLGEAGLDGDAILTAATSAPAAYWGWSDLGRLAPGQAASLLVVSRDPRVDPVVLTDPVQVWIGGVRRK
jgi:imidazolonepropionase-like amidohydrolase